MKDSKMILFLIICFTVFIYACNNGNKKILKIEQLNENENEAIEKSNDKLLLHYYKTSCFGKCPQFELNLNVDGSMNYRGIKNVKLIGDYAGQLEKVELDSLISSFELSNFDDFESTYLLEISDLPKSNILFRNNSVSFHQRIAPAKIKELERKIIHLRDKTLWKIIQE